MNKGYPEGAFHRDGSLRDIYIQNVTIEHWETFLSFIRDGGFGYRYARDGSAARLPPTATQILGDKSSAHNLGIDLGGVEACCHFFAEDEIELDIDPREVNSPGSEEKVLNFMALLGAALDRDVILTEENRREDVWFRYSPRDGVVHKEQPG